MIKISAQINYQNKENTAIANNTVFKLNKPERNNPLQEVFREDAHKMLVAAIKAEIAYFFIERIVL